MEPERMSVVERLIYDLNSLRRDAGEPSLSQLARLSNRKLSKSTIHDHLSGRRTQLPTWRLVSAYVSACHAAAASTGLEVGRLGTLDEWHARWDAAKDELEVASPADKSADVNSNTIVLDLNQRTEIAEISSRLEQGKLAVSDKSTSSNKWATPILQRLEEDFRKLAQSLPAYTGLLVVTSGPAVGTRFAIEHNITTIGRDPESDIWLNDLTVSRRHAVIRRYGDRFFANDSESRNGTFLQRNRVGSETLLSSYDELRVSTFSFLFIQGGEKAVKSLQKRYLPVRSRLAEDISATTSTLKGFALKEEVPDVSTDNSEGTRWRQFRRRSRPTE